MVFTTLLFGKGLSATELARANGLVSGDRVTLDEQTKMTEQTGWTLIDQQDTTTEYRDIVLRDLRAYESRREQAANILGTAELEARLQRKRQYLEGITDGLLHRAFFVAETRG